MRLSRLDDIRAFCRDLPVGDAGAADAATVRQQILTKPSAGLDDHRRRICPPSWHGCAALSCHTGMATLSQAGVSNTDGHGILSRVLPSTI
jgi:hypothetical protein